MNLELLKAMKRTSLLLVSIILCFSLNSVAQVQATPSKEILDKAFKLATQEDKNVFVIFHASWCGWCKRMDAAMNDPSCKDFFDKSYIIEHLVVYEPDSKKHLENPGAEDLLTRHGGEGQGIPFWLIFDKSGVLITDSKNEYGNNIGCPASDNEVAAFIDKLEDTSSLTAEEVDIISGRFKKNRN
jgi:thiol-disulfide isomerase/thioredoxin